MFFRCEIAYWFRELYQQESERVEKIPRNKFLNLLVLGTKKLFIPLMSISRRRSLIIRMKHAREQADPRVASWDENLAKKVEDCWLKSSKEQEVDNWIKFNRSFSQNMIALFSLLNFNNAKSFRMYTGNGGRFRRDLYDNRIEKIPFQLKLLFLAYILSSCMICIQSIFQYKYDLSLYRYDLYMSKLINDGRNISDSKPANNISLEKIFQLCSYKQSLKHNRDILISVGAPFLDHNFAAEFIAFYLNLTAFVAFFQTCVCNYFIKPMDSRTLRLILRRDLIIKHYASTVIPNEYDKFFLRWHFSQ